MPTVWNQIEASMAYTLERPLLVIAEHGLRSEGLLESNYDWPIQWVDLTPGSLSTNPCLGVIQDWARRVIAFDKAHERPTASRTPITPDLGAMTVADIIGQMRPGQVKALAAAATAVVVAAFVVGAIVGHPFS